MKYAGTLYILYTSVRLNKQQICSNQFRTFVYRKFRVTGMPPKKKEEEKSPIFLGRFGTSLKCGIVGIPNVG